MSNSLNRITFSITCLIFIFTMESCFLFIGVKNKSSEPAADTHVQNGFAKAIIINYKLDGCTFMIQLEDEKKLEPVNLEKEFKKDNFKVWIKYRHYAGNSICMAGEMVTVTAIEKRE